MKKVPYKLIFLNKPTEEGEADEICIRDKASTYVILPSHGPLAGTLSAGAVSIKTESGKKEHNYLDGFVICREGRCEIALLKTGKDS